MTARRLFLLALLLLGTGLLGCDTTATRPESQVVVESYLRANLPLPSVRMTRTVGVDAAYDPAEDAVEGAEVVVDRLADDSTVVTTVPYTENDSLPGFYSPVNPPLVAPEATYRLRATTSDGTEIRATTTVPGPIEIRATENDTATYQSERQPSLTVQVERPERIDRRAGRQNVFTLTTTSLLDFKTTPEDTLRAALTPFYADGFDAEDDSLESLRRNSSGLLNEANFKRNEDGTITIDLPWLAIAFFGPNDVGVSVVDENYYDFLRSQNVQQGGFAPGEIPNVIEHVDGGTGIFGSYAQATRTVFVLPPTRRP